MLRLLFLVAGLVAASPALRAAEVVVVDGEAVVIERRIVNGQPAVIEQVRHTSNEAIQEFLDSRRADVTQTLALQLDKLDRICKLTEDQQRRLRVAAKGAVDQQLEGYREELLPRPPAEDADGDGAADLVQIEPESGDDDHDHDHVNERPQPPQVFGGRVALGGGVR